jgi:nucleoside-diphosphate-sugar epimerase
LKPDPEIHSMSAKILITGGTGFLGSHLAEHLARESVPVRVLVRRTSQVGFLQKLGVELCEGSLEDEAGLRRAVQGCSAVVHCAGAIKVRRLEEFDAVNVGGTRRLLEACTATSEVRRFVLVSSLAAQGPAESPAPPADAPPRPVSEYGRSKLAAERETLRFADRLVVVAVRPPAIYGPRDQETFPFFRFASWGLLPVLGDGTSLVSMIYATDVAQALHLCATAPEVPSGAVYGVSDGAPHSWVEIGQSMAAVFGRRGRTVPLPLALFSTAAHVGALYSRLFGKAVMFTPDKLAELRQKYWLCDNTRIHKDIGFAPAVELTQGIPLAIEWYRQNGWL